MKATLSILLASIALLCSCSGGIFDSAERSTSSSLNIGEVALTPDRSATVLNPTDDAIGLFLAAGTSYNAMDNVKYIYGTAWSAASTEIKLNAEAANICAYYPYVNGATRTKTLTPTPYTKSADLCYKTGLTASITSPDLSFEMGHAYSKLTLNISKGTYSGLGNITSFSFANAGLITSSTLNIRDESKTNVTIGGTYTDAAPAIVNLDAAVTKEYLMVPCTLSGSTTLSFTVDGKVLSGVIPSSKLGALVAGRNHTITVALDTLQALVISSVTTTDWDLSSTNIAWGKFYSTANCYMVSPSSSKTIPVNVKGNADIATAVLGGVPITHLASSVGVLWQTAESLITTSFNKVNQTATITAGSKEGNAVIAAYGTDGSILWSWHIWVTDEPAEETNNGNSWMDRNLGATARASNTADTTFATCGGLFYQWGRKDPFPGSDGLTSGTTLSLLTAQTLYNTNLTWPSDVFISSTGSPNDVVRSAWTTGTTISYTNQCAYSIKYPLLFLIHWTGSTATAIPDYNAVEGKDSWGGEFGASKSIFDPCPLGWRVPSARKSSSALVSPWYTWTKWYQMITTCAYSAIRWKNSDTYGTYYYPAAGWRDHENDGAFANVGCEGYYWSATVTSNSYCSSLHFYDLYTYLETDSRRAYGFSVRCVREW